MHLFYQPLLKKQIFRLENEEFAHCTTVLRHKEGDHIKVTDGNGLISEAKIISIRKKQLEFEVISSLIQERKKFYHHLLIAPTKNTDRMEWMIEKISEFRLDELTFIHCDHSERKKLRLDRLEKKAISAMKQSGSAYITKINELTNFSSAISLLYDFDVKGIAVVDPSNTYFRNIIKPNSKIATLIGPEGDFSSNEVKLAKENGFMPITLGESTLRTETAGLAVSMMVNMINEY